MNGKHARRGVTGRGASLLRLGPSRIADHWNRYFFTPVPPHGLALIRIALGVFLLVFWIVYLPRVPMLFSDVGIVIPYADAPLLAPPAVLTAIAVYALTLLCILGVLLGWQMRLGGLLLCVLLLYYFLLSFHHFPSSFSRILLFVTFVVSLSGADRALSVHIRQTTGSWRAWEAVPVWPQRLLAIQVASTYLGVGIQKAYLPGWQGGEILAHSFLNAWSTPFAFTIAQWNIPIAVYDIGVVATKILHGVLPIGLFIPWMQRWCMVLGTLFHIGVTLVMGMWWFLVLIPLYIAFVKPEAIRMQCEGVCGRNDR
jgi:hypothetical protein